LSDGNCTAFADVANSVAEISSFLLGIIGVMFLLGFVMNIVQAQTAYGTGDPRGYAHALQAILVSVFLVCLAYSANTVSTYVASYICSGATDSASALKIWIEIAKIFATMVIAAGIGWTMVYLVGQAMMGIIDQMLGMPNALAGVIKNLAFGIIGLLITIFSIGIGNAILNMAAGGH